MLSLHARKGCKSELPPCTSPTNTSESIWHQEKLEFLQEQRKISGFCVCGGSGMDGWKEWREEGMQITVYVVCVMCYCLRMYTRMAWCLPILSQVQNFLTNCGQERCLSKTFHRNIIGYISEIGFSNNSDFQRTSFQHIQSDPEDRGCLWQNPACARRVALQGSWTALATEIPYN